MSPNYTDPDQLRALADRIDYDQQWRRGPFDETMTQAEHDRCDAGVNLRRYASALGLANERRKEGKEYMRGYKLERVSHGTYHFGCGDNWWHSAINIFHDRLRALFGKEAKFPRMMYGAKQLSDEVPRMILLFEEERKGLAESFKMCAHDPAPAVELPDNHLKCHLGVECRKCQFLAAIESSGASNEAKDEAKAWTCATHILLASSEDDYIEGYLHDKSDAIMNERMARAFGANFDTDPPMPPEQ